MMARNNNKSSTRNMSKNLRLRAARVMQGLTQLQLADLVDLKEVEISRIETGRSTPADDLKRRLAEVLKKPTFELFES